MMRIFFRNLVLASVLAVLAGSADAQRFKFDHYTADSGLAASFILNISQDDRGHLWFATLNGLSRFDGREFTNFGTADGLTGQRISTAFRGPDGRLFLGTASGLSVWDGLTVRNYGLADGLGAGSVWSIAVDRNGAAWIGTQAGGLSRLTNAGVQRWTRQDGLPSDFIYALTIDSKNRLWIGSRDNGFALAEIGNGGEIAIRHRWSSDEGLPSPIVHSFLEELDGSMLVGTRGGGIWRAGDDGGLERVAPQLSTADVYAMSRNGSGALLVALVGGGVRICSPPGYDRCLSLDSSNGLTSNAITAVIEDREGSLWIGTASGALRLAGHDFLSYGKREGLSADFAFSIMPDGDDALWISSFEGVTQLRSDAQGRLTPSRTLTVADGLPSNEIWYVLRDRSDNLWMATANGLCLYTDGRGCRTFGAESGLPSRLILGLFEDRDGRVWVSTRGGVARLERNVRPDDTHITDMTALEGVEIASTVQATDGGLWFAGTETLARLADDEWTTWRTGDELGIRTINDILAMKNGSIWISTNDQGLARYDPTLPGPGIVHVFGRESGLPSLSIASIVEDSQGFIWAGSSEGLLKVDPEKAGTPAFMVRQYTLDDGLVSQEAAGPHSFTRAPGGDLWFAFSGAATRYVDFQGMGTEETIVEPIVMVDSIHADQTPVYAAPFSTMGSTASPDEAVSAPLGARNIAVSYGAAVYKGRRTLEYQYRLDGYDPGWTTTTRHSKEYTKLPPGDYTFRVRARLAEGDWSRVDSVRLAIPPLIHETIWFRGLAASLVILLVLLAHRVRTQSMHRRNRELAELVAERTRDLEQRSHDLEETNIELEHANVELDTINRLLKDADTAKSRFLASMSHELRTPLNSIIGFTDIMITRAGELEEKKRATFLQHVRHSATVLLGLINDILDISKIEAGRMEVHIVPASVREIVDEVAESMRFSADEKRTKIVVECDGGLESVHVDVTKVRQILQNLISNAIKYSGDGATVVVSAKAADRKEAGLGTPAFEIGVAENGQGIPADQIEGIFEEYRQARQDSKRGLGTGLGLAIVCKFAELQGGRVTVESELGKGTTFRVWLPIDASNWDSET